MSNTNRHKCPYCGSVNRHRASSAGTTQRCDDCGRKYKVGTNSGMGCFGCLMWMILIFIAVTIVVSYYYFAKDNIQQQPLIQKEDREKQLTVGDDKETTDRTAKEREKWMRKFYHVWVDYDEESVTVYEKEWKKLTPEDQYILCLTVVQVVHKTPRNKGAIGNYTLKVLNQDGEQLHIWK